jgi:hypothetical protein
LDINDDFRFAKLFLQALVLPAQLLVFHRKCIVLRLGSPLPGKRLLNGRLPFAAPVGQRRGIQTLSPKQRSDVAGSRDGVCFRQNLSLVFGRELPTTRTRNYLRINLYR